MLGRFGCPPVGLQRPVADWLTGPMSAASTSEARSLRRRGQVCVALAALAWSTAGLIQRELSVDTATQVSGRALFAGAAMLAYVRFVERRGTVRAFLRMGWAGLSVAIFTAIASSTFIVALNHTSVANVLFLQALAPLLAALIAWIGLGEPVTRRTLVAMAIALAGVAVMVGSPGGAHGLGLALSALMTLSFALGVVITRREQQVSMAPAACLSQLIVLVAFGPFAHPRTVDASNLGLIVALGVCQIGLGLVLLTIGARLLPAAEVAVIVLLEVVLGPLWVWLVLREQPGSPTLIGGAIVIVAVILQSVAPRSRVDLVA